MKLDYNIDYSIAAAVFLAIFIMFVCFSYDLHVRKNRGFLWLVVFILLADVFDIVTAYTISNSDIVPDSLNIALNEIYYLVLASLGFLFLRYAQAVAGKKDYDNIDGRKHAIPLRTIHYILMGSYLALLVINIPTGVMMTFKDGEYIHGPLYFVLFFFPYLEVAFAFTRVIMTADEFKKRRKRILVWIYFAFCVASAAVQLFIIPKILISIFAVAIGLTFLMILMETPDYQGMMAVLEKLRDAQEQMREQATAEQRRSQSKTDFLLHLSHELRTPLNAIIGYSELILGDRKKQAAADDVKKIRTASRNLLSIADNIKNFIEIEDENVSIENENYDTVNLIEDMKRKLQFLNADKGLTLKLIVDPDLPSVLYGDRIRIEQLMDTLNSNAVKYTKHGEVDISIEWKGNGVTFTVEDTGVGMKPAELKRISESFFKTDRDGTSSGLGLGLAFATKLLSLMGSKLEYESAYKVGSRFWFTLKQENISQDHIGEEKAMHLADFTEAQLEANKKLDVLVVDDNQINIDITVRLLSAGGCHVETAMNGQEALERIRDRKKSYDIIFMDHLMPVMDGVEAMDTIRAENLCPDTPVIALTANAVTDVEREYEAHGFADYMLKPVTQGALFDMIDRHCGPDSVVREQAEPEPEDNIEIDIGQQAAAVEPPKDPMTALGEFLNTKAGLEYCGGMPDFYLDIINDYINADKREELGKQLADKDFDNYRIGVHSLKSSSRTIGADDLSEKAKSLEDACKSGDTAYIEKNHAGVMEEYGELLKKLDAALHPEDNKASEEAVEVSETLDAATSGEQPSSTEKKEKILLVASFDLERNILSFLLGKDYDVVETADLEHARVLIEKEQPDLCIFDSEMTIGHENEFAELPVPLIFLTDERDRQAKIRSVSCGGADIIDRPIDERFMKRRIRGVLASKEAAV